MRGPCSALRVATIRQGDYVEPLTYLLFLKIRPAERFRHSTLANTFSGKLIASHDEPVQGSGRNCESSAPLLRSWSLSA
jgi:hypothetical protein